LTFFTRTHSVLKDISWSVDTNCHIQVFPIFFYKSRTAFDEYFLKKNLAKITKKNLNIQINVIFEIFPKYDYLLLVYNKSVTLTDCGLVTLASLNLPLPFSTPEKKMSAALELPTTPDFVVEQIFFTKKTRRRTRDRISQSPPTNCEPCRMFFIFRGKRRSLGQGC
jgi:hypothetical protein